MSQKNYWDLTNRPYTKLKLRILKEYLQAWASIIFNQAFTHKWSKWQDVYYVDCFCGRGKYHNNGKENIIKGSPLIALECAENFQTKYNGIRMHCLFVEISSKSCARLKKFCEPYRSKVDYKIFNEKDFNQELPNILNIINGHPAFFFIDPDGIKELKKENLKKIVARNVATDLLINYIKGGVERIVGLT